MRPLLALLLAAGLSACAADTAPDPVNPPAASAEAPAPEVVQTTAPLPADAPMVTVYKSPTCGCCQFWADHMTASGFAVETRDVDNLATVRDSLGMPADIGSCHTAVVDGYVVEGHVPAEQVRRLLAEKPEARGLSVPGMPLGSPGMEQGDMRQPYDVLLVGLNGEAVVYEHIPGS